MTSSEDHFNTSGGKPDAKGRFVDVNCIEPVEMLPGLEFRPVLGVRSMVNVVHFEPHTEAPHHVHEEEQIVMVLDGELEFDIDGDVRTMRAGDMAVVPAWVPHGAHTIETTCREIDVFTPQRRTLLEHARAQVRPADPGAASTPDS